jgi:hypothetical protein
VPRWPSWQAAVLVVLVVAHEVTRAQGRLVGKLTGWPRQRRLRA